VGDNTAILALGSGLSVRDVAWAEDSDDGRDRIQRDARAFLDSLVAALELPTGSFNISLSGQEQADRSGALLDADPLNVSIGYSTFDSAVTIMFYRSGDNYVRFISPDELLDTTMQLRFVEQCRALSKPIAIKRLATD
jgi:hypothetical protein